MNERIEILGQEILSRCENQSKGSIFSKDYWYGRIMEWSMKNEGFKTKMFRFVDVLPTLTNNNDVARHLKEYFTEGGSELPSVFNVGLGLGSLAPGLMAGAIRKNVTQMAKMFICGETIDEALPVLTKARNQDLAFTVDILGESTLGEEEAHLYQTRYSLLIEGLSQESFRWMENRLIDHDSEGPIPKVNVSVKLTALFSQINAAAWNQTKAICKDRLRPLFLLAQAKQVFLNLDMEHYGVKQLTLEVFKELIMEPELRAYPFFGCVIQAYLRDSSEDLRDLIQWAEKRETPFTVRLVKGAYWDSETIEAQQKDWPIPVYTVKSDTDANYELCSRWLLDHHKVIRGAFASHNVRSLANILAYAEKLGLNKASFEIQMLYGMADPIKKSLVEMGYRVREYAPIGDLIPGMAYLVRRLLENTSNESWLKSKFADNESNKRLLQDPNLLSQAAVAKVSLKAENTRGFEFHNEPLLDFAILEHRQKLQEALLIAKKSMPMVVPVIQGQAREPAKIKEWLERPNPSKSSEIVTKIGLANVADADLAMLTAHQSFATWKKTSVDSRSLLAEKLADQMSAERYQLIAEQVLEVGKPWAEADGDIAEAIDFCRYYARHMKTLVKPRKVGQAPGEVSLYHYQPRGVSVVIAPWNFPLAILAGQVLASLMTGNTVVMKPAEQSSRVAASLMRMILAVGFPPGVVQFLPGLGEVVGEHLVKHPLTANIAFTGSKAVGLHILKRAQEVTTTQSQLKRCVIEMGGKNAVIVDSDADLDEAVDAVVYSAFGFAGQKCSACSRVIVLEEIYVRFKERLLDAVKSIVIGSAEDPSVYLGPVVDAESQLRILQKVKEATLRNETASLLYQGATTEDGYFVGPTIIEVTDKNHSLCSEELFGPVLVLLKAKDLDEALVIANEVEYALTGGIFSRSPAHIEKAKAEFAVGNLYINRGITGAMVDRHPFGGFKMSGIGSKTGGPDYLLQFMEPRTITENTMRRGFAPVEENTND